MKLSIKRKNKSTYLVLLLGASAVVASGLGIAAALAENAPGTQESWTAPGRAARKENPVAVDAKSIAVGKQLFVTGCVPCHGVTGRGDGPASSTLERNGVPVRPGNLSDPKMWQQTDGAIFWKLTEGKSPMPSWGESYSEEQRWQVINYVRTLAPPEAGKPQIAKTGGSQ